MTGAGVLGRALLVAVLVVATAGLYGPASTVATFTDAEIGEGNVTAADNFGGAGNWPGPTADAGGPYTVNEGGRVALDSSGSTAPKGNIQSESWTVVSGPGTITTQGQNWYYNAPANVGSDTTVTVELTVTDNQGYTDTDTATVTVLNN